MILKKKLLNFILLGFLVLFLSGFPAALAGSSDSGEKATDQPDLKAKNDFGLIPDQYHPPAFNCVTRYENGWVNWTTGEILAFGFAVPEDNSEKSHDAVPGAARADANRSLIDILKQIKIDSSLNVREYAKGNDVILAGIERIARDAMITKQYYTSALSVEISIETSILGGFLQLVLPEKIRQIPQIIVDPPPAPVDRTEPYQIKKRAFTGLIVDAGNLDFKPVLNPVIISEQGDELFSAKFVSREFAVQKGVCRYFCSLSDAQKDERTGSNPFVFKALRKEGRQDAIVISTADQSRFKKAEERHVFLKECRVTIVTGR